MGAGLWKTFSRLGVCFVFQWLARFDTKFLKCWYPHTTGWQSKPGKPWNALYFDDYYLLLLNLILKEQYFKTGWENTKLNRDDQVGRNLGAIGSTV